MYFFYLVRVLHIYFVLYLFDKSLIVFRVDGLYSMVCRDFVTQL